MTHPGGRPPKYETAEEMQRDIDLYFETDAWVIVGKDENGEDKKEFRPTMSGLAFAVDMSRQSLVNYGKKDQFFDTVRKARQKVEIALELQLHNGAVAGTIFNLKNNFGWNDKTETQLTGANGGAIQTDNKWTVEFVNASPESK